MPNDQKWLDVEVWAKDNNLAQMYDFFIQPDNEPTVELWFTGFYVVAESDELSEQDEPYFNLAATPVPGGTTTVVSLPTQEVDAGDRTEVHHLLYRGKPCDLMVTALIMEEDHGSEADVKKNFIDVVTKAGSKLPVVGDFVTWVVEGLADLLGLTDDLVAQRAEMVSSQQLRSFALSEGPNEWSPPADFIWRMGKPGEGIYHLHFLVRQVD